VFAYPLAAGGGLKGKVLEALAHGVPLVTTRAGIAGVEAKHGLQAFIEDDNDQFAERVVELLEHPDLRRRLAEAGRMLVEERYAPGPVVDQIESVYRTVAAGR
jgi:glycosyltransferase involved in cell wall biosynthesis